MNERKETNESKETRAMGNKEITLSNSGENATSTEKSAVVKNSKFNDPFINFLLVAVFALGILLLLSRFNLMFDLTKNSLHTLSDVSKNTVAELRDPLRISVFISKNLPPPLNDLRRSVEDLLYLYAQEAGKNFTFVFYDIDEKEEGNKAVEVARDYGISPQQVQSSERDEIKLVNAYLAMVIEYGDLIEKIPVIDVNSSLELEVSSILDRMNSRINRLIALENPIEVVLLLPQNFVAVSQYFGVDKVETVQASVSKLAEEAVRKNYGKIDYQEHIADFPVEYENLVTGYPWRKFTVDGKTFEAGEGAAALILKNGDEVAVVELLVGENSLQLTEAGFQQVTKYRLADEEEISARFEAAIETVLQVNKRVAVLNENGASDFGIDSYQYGQGGQPSEAANFGTLAKRRYQLSAVSLADLDERYGALVVSGVKEKLSDFQLYKIDQFLMKGGALVVFHDMFVEVPAEPGQSVYGNIPRWEPNPSGLEKLLQHYGVEVKPSIVMDEKSFVGRQQQATGTLTEQAVYFAPLIQNNYINSDFLPTKFVRGFMMIAGSPLLASEEDLLKRGVLATKIFSSTPRSWLQEGEISLVPFLIQKPDSDENFASYSFGYALESEAKGGFKSFFTGKEIPVANETAEAEGTESDGNVARGFEDSEKRLETSVEGARLAVISSSQMVKNNVIDTSGASPNAMLALNLLDYVAKQDEWIPVRAKNQSINPLDPYDAEAGFFKKMVTNPRIVKTVNMAFWPFLVAIFAGWNYLRRQKHRRLVKNL